MDWFFDFLRFCKEVFWNTASLVECAAIAFIWLIVEKVCGKELPVKIVWAVIGTCFLFAAFGAWREQYLQIKKDLRFTITEASYSPETNRIRLQVSFRNNGTITRQILGYQFLLQQYLEPKRVPGKQSSRVYKSLSIRQSIWESSIESSEIKVAPAGVEAATYEQQVNLSDLMVNKREFINLQIKFLSSDGKIQFKTIDNVIWVEDDASNGVSVGKNTFEDVSLDEGASAL